MDKFEQNIRKTIGKIRKIPKQTTTLSVSNLTPQLHCVKINWKTLLCKIGQELFSFEFSLKYLIYFSFQFQVDFNENLKNIAS